MVQNLLFFTIFFMKIMSDFEFEFQYYILVNLGILALQNSDLGERETVR